MSHLVSVKTRVTDPASLSAACRRLGLAEPVQGTAELFSASATGLIVKLPGMQQVARGTQVKLDLLRWNEVDLTVEARLLEIETDKPIEPKTVKKSSARVVHLPLRALQSDANGAVANQPSATAAK